ncbi:alanine--tRNA ligase [Secundilactobacillus similis]|uniref:Alanine--tRNA ligase n=1 Tax=Secundilactobacillus similis DSM 23365 = JCM 2765 TaxID=1423804 RepID=A0A0R2EQ11_9LACO|nr:alanine--tRNA ligase [Secundilactobacillus similis]KRN18432.1 alanyl-tRNA synthetase [Secundilactobacillus similis DSM 23365 = JCM 2765]
MKELSSSQIRQMYLDFFKSKGHTIMPSASLVPVDDPTLLWINSGVATMKNYFNGSVVPKNPRMTSSQKSIRTNDIENVGRTARHHTLFEMLGNFSVGDYFKDEAIAWAWELLTSDDWFGWDPEKLYMTVYPKDDAAKKRWLEVGVAPDHIIEAEDNFWDIGEGPSGPDSEIFYDRGQSFNNLADDDPENYPGGENERYLEVWNIVFSQFNHEPDGSYKPLPRKNIDTGMGLERVVSVFQHAKTNFETDLFLPMIHATETYSDGKKYGEDAKEDVSFKVIADHARAITFAIGDGALPSNEGRGYVIRRLIRRAVVNGQKLGVDGAFLYKLVPVVGEAMKAFYPEVLENSDYIAKVVKSEEDRFNETLTDGLNLLNALIAETKKAGQKEIDGAEAFKLYDTYGFPVELTREYAFDEGIGVDEDGFEAEMQQQRDRARKARNSDNSMGVQTDLLIGIKSPSEYVGYTQLAVDDAKISDILADGAIVDAAESGLVQVIFDKTPFYAEMGGQIADQGDVLDADGNVIATVEDVQHAPNGQNLHTLKLNRAIKVGETVTLKVNEHFHSKVEKNHTATHLLDQALRNVFGEHTQQAGSLVEPNYLRFDFTHFGQVTEADLAKVEAIVNEKIFEEIPVTTVETDQETGKKMGAIALFSDKYGDKVRVVSIGDFSIEFCGGTHVKNTNELGLFKITSETGIGAGTRRIEAVTAGDAFAYLNDHDQLLEQAAGSLKAQQVSEVPGKISQLQDQIKALTNKADSLEAKLASQQAGQIFDNVQTVNGKQLITGVVQVSSMDQLRQLADTWRQKKLSDVLVLGAQVGEKANLIAAVSDDSIKDGLKAGDLIKAISPKINGGGGGRPNMAQAGGKNPAGLQDAMTEATNWLANLA